MDIVIIGAGGHGKVVLDILRSAGSKVRPIGFLDADPAMTGSTVCGLPVLGTIYQISKLKLAHKIHGAIVAIGDNRARQSYAQHLKSEGVELINAIHPRAIVSSSANIGQNVVIAAGAIVCADATIGDSVILNTACVVDHECEIAEAVHICPTAALAGRVRVGAGAFLGIGAKVIQCLSIGCDAMIGAGAVVIEDVPAGATAVGCPARIVKTATVAA